ncbi:MAG: hypothetical protein WC624_04650 [Candidatus Margulisiibacteriota bacterium]
MYYMILIALISLSFGLLLLLSPEKLEWLSAISNKNLINTDAVLMSARNTAGVLMLIAGGLMFWLVFPYPGLWAINIISAIALVFGLLFLFFPKGLKSLLEFSDRNILSKDDFVVGSRKSFGILLIILSVYIFYAALYNILNK